MDEKGKKNRKGVERKKRGGEKRRGGERKKKNGKRVERKEEEGRRGKKKKEWMGKLTIQRQQRSTRTVDSPSRMSR